MTTLQEYLQTKYPTLEAKAEVQELILTQITEHLAGGQLDLTAFSNLEKVEIDPNLLSTPLTKIITSGLTKLKEIVWLETEEESEENKKLFTELEIAGDIVKKKVVKEVKRLAKIKGAEVRFRENPENDENSSGIFLDLDQKDKQGNFNPNLIFWNLANELATINFPGEKTPAFWEKFSEELNWIKDNLNQNYQKEFELLLNPSTFPRSELEIKELFTIYFPSKDWMGENITDRLKVAVNEKIIAKTWQTIQQKLNELVGQELANNPENKENLAFKATLDYQNEEYIIQAQYHSESPFGKEIAELVITTPLKLEIENLKQKQEKSPTPENFHKLEKQNQLWDNYLQDFTDKEKYQEIKDKINKID